MIGMETNHRPVAEKTVSQSAAKIVEDVVVLAELQWQLLVSDSKQYASRMAAIGKAVAAAVVLFLAAIFLGLAALVLALISAGISPALACALVALVAIVAAAALLLWSRTRIRRMSGAFARSRAEVAQNATWIKEVIAARKGDFSDA